MFRALFLPALLSLVCLPPGAAAQVYTAKVSEWQAAAPPPASDKAERAVWAHAANTSRLHWRVYLEAGQVRAAERGPTASRPPAVAYPLSGPASAASGRARLPPFEPRVRGYAAPAAVAEVDDGWLIAYSDGEFGAALYWFSADGRQNHEISRNQVLRFFILRDGLYAIEGLAHLGLSRGAVLRLERPPGAPRWQVRTVAQLPYAPCAVSVRRDDTAVITLSDALVVLGRDRNISTLIADAPWGLLYPGNSVLTPDEARLYIGMRQYVAEVDMVTRQLRLLVPSAQFINRLSKPQEARVRALGGG